MLNIKPITLYELLSIVISLAGFIIIMLTVRQLARQSSLIEKSLEYSSFNIIRDQLMSSNNIFIKNPELRPYFYEGVFPDEKDINLKRRIDAVSETILDLLEMLLIHKIKYFDQVWPRSGLESYMRDMFLCSPSLCAYLIKKSDWYIKDLRDIMEEIREKHSSAQPDFCLTKEEIRA